MRTSGRSDSPHWSRGASVTNRTAVYGPVCTVVWQGSAGNRCLYADLTGHPEVENADVVGLLALRLKAWLGNGDRIRNDKRLRLREYRFRTGATGDSSCEVPVTVGAGRSGTFRK